MTDCMQARLHMQPPPHLPLHCTLTTRPHMLFAPPLPLPQMLLFRCMNRDAARPNANEDYVAPLFRLVG